jgi:hypothetical protein
MKKKVRNCEINLGYYKQGDDFGYWLKKSLGNVQGALELHAKSLEEDAKHLRSIRNMLENVGVFTAEGDTHSIYLTVDDDEVIREAIENGLITEMLDEEE